MATDKDLLDLLQPVIQELRRAEAKFAPFHSAHEGWAVLYEEVDELWDAVKMQYSPERDEQLMKEAIQVTAMGLRFLLFLRGAKL